MLDTVTPNRQIIRCWPTLIHGDRIKSDGESDLIGWRGGGVGGGIGHFCGVLALIHGGRSGSWNKFDAIGSNHILVSRIYRILKGAVSVFAAIVS